MNYKSYRLEKICKVKSGKRLPPGCDFSDTPTPYQYIRAHDIRNGNIDISNPGFISKDTHAKISRYIVNTNDIVLTIAGTIGEAALVPDVCNGMNLTENAVRLTEFSKCVFPPFLAYILKSPAQKEQMKQIAGGAAQPKLGIYKVKAIQVRLPNMKTQRHMVAVLSAYDRLIENSQKQIKLLEEEVRRLYKEWFVNLRFPGHETALVVDGVPVGWRKFHLKDVIACEIGGGWGEELPTDRCDCAAYVIRGTDLFDITHGNALGIPFRYHSRNNLLARTLVDGDIIFEVSGGSKTEGVARTALIRSPMLALWKKPAICASFCKLIRPVDTKYAQFIFDTLQYMRFSGKTTEYDKRSASSIVNYRWRDFLNRETIVLPSDEVLKKYNLIAESAYQTILRKSISIEKAREARDRLLPKLMSGEMEVQQCVTIPKTS